MSTGGWKKKSRAEIVAAREARLAKWGPGTNRYLAPFVPSTNPVAGARRMEDKGQLAKRTFLNAASEGKNYREAANAAGVTDATAEGWRYEDQEFRAALDYVRKEGPTSSTKADGFEAFRKKYFGFDSYYHHREIIRAIESAPPMSKSMILCAPEHGKALALDTPLPTPTGWTTMKEVEIGDELLNDQGKPCRVTFKSEVFYDHDCYEVRSDDGASVIADADHLWPVRLGGYGKVARKSRLPLDGPPGTRGMKRLSVDGIHIQTTEFLAKPRSKRPELPVARPLDLPEADLPIDPYVLGVWLGDGNSDSGRVTAGDQDYEELAALLRLAGQPVRSSKYASSASWTLVCTRDESKCERGHPHTKGRNCRPCNTLLARQYRTGEPMPPRTNVSLTEKLRDLDVLGNKHIPERYLRASRNQRLSLLQGLIDTDGSVDTRGTVEFTGVNRRLVEGVRQLVWSLGVKASFLEGRATIDGRDCGPKYRVVFYMEGAARLARKAERTRNAVRTPNRYLTVTPVESVPTQCVQVDSPSHLYLAGEGMLVTHNTSVLTDYICYRIAKDPNVRITVVSEGEGHAKKIVGHVQRRMTDKSQFADYIADFGPFKAEDRDGKPWAATHFTVAGADHDEKDFTLEARGASSAIYGTRTDLLIFDDIQSRRNLNQTEKLVDTIRQDFLSRPGKEGRTIFVGTRVDVGDVYEVLLEQGVIDTDCLVQLPATNPVEVPCPKPKICRLHEDCCGLHRPDDTAMPHESPLCEEMWPAHELAVRRKDVSEPTWLRSYQQRPQAAGSATFSEEMIEGAKDKFRKIGEHEGGTVILGLDPALGGQCALSACVMYPDKFEVIDMSTQIGLGRVEQIMYMVESFAQEYKPSYLVVETDTLQKGLARDERLLELAKQHNFIVIEHRTAGQKADETIGVASMAGTFSRGEFRIPWADAYAQRRMSVLVEELGAWRATVATKRLRQDSVMSVWFPWRYWRDVKDTLTPGAGRKFNKQGLPFKRMSVPKMRRAS